MENSMIPLEKAAITISEALPPLKTERINFMYSLSRVLAEDIRSDTDIPPFSKSAMDGFACRKADLNNSLEVIEEIPAGKVPFKKIGMNQCARIMTGGMMPDGADIVVQIEHVKESGPQQITVLQQVSSENICYRGEDVRKGEIILSAGDVITPSQIAILATSGITNPLVYALPSVAILSTGNELIEPDEIAGPSQIRNSNAWQIMAQCITLDYHPDYLGIVRDEQDRLKERISFATAQYDILIISGGVSVGDYDFVPSVIRELGGQILFHGLRAKPGKHLLFAQLDHRLIFGLPGNPVSSFVQFELLIKPLLLKMKGVEKDTNALSVPITSHYSRKKADTVSFVPGRWFNGQVSIPDYHGSAHIHAFKDANCIIEIPEGVNVIQKGEIVHVRPL